MCKSQISSSWVNTPRISRHLHCPGISKSPNLHSPNLHTQDFLLVFKQISPNLTTSLLFSFTFSVRSFCSFVALARRSVPSLCPSGRAFVPPPPPRGSLLVRSPCLPSPCRRFALPLLFGFFQSKTVDRKTGLCYVSFAVRKRRPLTFFFIWNWFQLAIKIATITFQ